MDFSMDLNVLIASVHLFYYGQILLLVSTLALYTVFVVEAIPVALGSS